VAVLAAAAALVPGARLVGPAALAGQSSPVGGVFALENVTVIPMTGAERELAGHTVVVRDGVITAIGRASEVEVPADATRLDGDGKFLAPGLAEMVARLPAEDDPLRVITLPEALYLFLANGVTTIRSVNGSPYQLALRDDIGAGRVLGPRLLVGSPALDAVSAPDPPSAAARVREFAAAGYDFLTVEEDVPGAVWPALVEAAREAGIPLAGAPPWPGKGGRSGFGRRTPIGSRSSPARRRPPAPT
jgi:imidazolonepropionase-like amidohydrolase